MRFIYHEWDDQLFARLKELHDLMAIFNYLLMRLSGDVQETLQLMRRLQEQGILDEKYDLDEFEKKLEKSDLIRRGPGGMTLAPKGEQKLRQQAFDAIFSKLRASGRGDHRSHARYHPVER